jgi:hypothetical protein
VKKLDADQINTQKSSKRGVVGLFETTLRKIQTIGFIFFLLPLVALYGLALGFAVTPGYFLLTKSLEVRPTDGFLFYFIPSVAVGFGMVCFILGLLFIVPILNLPLRPLVKAYRGPWFSLESVPWFYHNALMYLVRYTILNLITPSPLATFFLKGMGMKIGKGALINTSNISDPCLIELGDYVTVGGSVYMMAHYGQKGFLIIDKLVVKRKANIGLHAYLMGAVEVGEAAQIYGNTMVLPKTKVPDYARFGHDLAKVHPNETTT